MKKSMIIANCTVLAWQPGRTWTKPDGSEAYAFPIITLRHSDIDGIEATVDDRKFEIPLPGDVVTVQIDARGYLNQYGKPDGRLVGTILNSTVKKIT